MRCCLLKGCVQSFHLRQSNQRHCSAECRKAARKWSRWKVQQRYRTTKSGKEKRSDQSRRYRQRVKHRKPPDLEADNEAGRVITPEYSFPLPRDAAVAAPATPQYRCPQKQFAGIPGDNRSLQLTCCLLFPGLGWFAPPNLLGRGRRHCHGINSATLRFLFA